MKILLDMGHCLSGADTGAQGNGYKEQDCTREIGYRVKAKLEALGNTVVIVSCDNSNSVGESLSYRVNKANSSGGDLYLSIHLNAGGGVGVEIYTYGAKPFTEAQNVLNTIVELGYTNRGIKDGSGLYVIRNTSMKAMLVECCFIDTSDMQKYNAENLANAIVKGLVGQTVDSQPLQPQPTPQPSQPSEDNGVLAIQRILNRLKIANLVEDGVMGNMTRGAIIKFQSICGIDQDGIWGNQSQNCADQILSKPLCGIPYTQRIASRYVQWRVGTSIDGIFGSGTASSVIRWQRDNDLDADGIVGNMSWSKLIG